MKNFRLSVISLILSIAILFSSVIIPSYAVNKENAICYECQNEILTHLENHHSN